MPIEIRFTDKEMDKRQRWEKHVARHVAEASFYKRRLKAMIDAARKRTQRENEREKRNASPGSDT